MKNIWRVAILAAAVIIVDQLTKGLIQERFSLGESISVIKGFFSITYVRNPGAAFGFMAGASESIRKPLFLLIPVLACAWLVYLIWQVRNKNTLLCFSYGLIFAGAIGNLIDRFTMGYVVDFVDFYINTVHFPAFNIADSSITIAAFLLIIDFYFEWKKKGDGIENASDSTSH